jgi:hypothetical protein
MIRRTYKMLYLVVPNPELFDVLKVGYWSGSKETLWTRYQTYYGNKMTIRLYEGDESHEKDLHTKFYSRRYHSELYPRVMLTELIEYLNKFKFIEAYEKEVKERRNLRTEEHRLEAKVEQERKDEVKLQLEILKAQEESCKLERRRIKEALKSRKLINENNSTKANTGNETNEVKTLLYPILSSSTSPFSFPSIYPTLSSTSSFNTN